MNTTQPALSALKKELSRLANPGKAKTFRRFFKSGPGEYAEGDRFLGVTVPQQRALAKRFDHLSTKDVLTLLKSPIHECRFTALVLLVRHYEGADQKERNAITRGYLRHTRYINNWDLVDTSAPHILGRNLSGASTEVLTKLAKSSSLWERRIAILSTQYFIRQHRFAETLRIATILLHDTHDLIHKAVGWMLREVGQRSKKTEAAFLKKYASVMPRTMLRYAIEKFSAKERRYYLLRTDTTK